MKIFLQVTKTQIKTFWTFEYFECIYSTLALCSKDIVMLEIVKLKKKINYILSENKNDTMLVNRDAYIRIY